MSILPGRVKAIIGDNIPFLRPEYFLVISTEYLCFFSQRPGRTLKVYSQLGLPSYDDRAVSSFLRKLRTEGNYFGQEITVLLAEPAAYTIFRSTASVSLDQLREECRLLAAGSKHHQEFRRIVLHGQSYYAIYGIDDEFLKKMLSQLDQNSFLIQRMATLSGFVLSLTNAATGSAGRLNQEVAVGQRRCRLAGDDKGNVYYYERAEECKDFLSEISSSWPMMATIDDNQTQTTKAGSQAKGTTKNKSSSNQRPRLSQASLRKEYSLSISRDFIPPRTHYLLIISGSARLLIMIAAVLLIGFLIAGGVYSVLAGGSRRLYESYQNDLTDVATLENTLRDLEKRLVKTGGDINPDFGLGASLSLFCQRVPANLYLTGLRVGQKADSGITIAAQGQAKDEAAIFQYRDNLNVLDSSVRFEIRSIARSGFNPGTSDSTWYKFTIGQK